jgi:hypothetical protein
MFLVVLDLHDGRTFRQFVWRHPGRRLYRLATSWAPALFTKHVRRHPDFQQTLRIAAVNHGVTHPGFLSVMEFATFNLKQLMCLIRGSPLG